MALIIIRIMHHQWRNKSTQKPQSAICDALRTVAPDEKLQDSRWFLHYGYEHLVYALLQRTLAGQPQLHLHVIKSGLPLSGGRWAVSSGIGVADAIYEDQSRRDIVPLKEKQQGQSVRISVVRPRPDC